MQIYYDIQHLPPFKNAVITIGTFDGVHAGHRHVLEQLKQEAAKVNGETVIITFHPHPRRIIHQEASAIYLLTTLDEKINLLRSMGIDHVVVVPFDKNFAEQTTTEYIEHFLFEKIHPHTIIIGYDHKFGKDRAGDYHLLEKEGERLGFNVNEISEHVLNTITISSTRIREALQHHEVETANEYLGYNYSFEGVVVEGNKLGRTIGFPTANIQVKDADKLIPANGVYAVSCEIIGDNSSLFTIHHSLFIGMMNIGIRPTINGTQRVIEVNLFDFDKDIYGQTIRIFVNKFIREEKKFAGLDELKKQLAADKKAAGSQ